MITQAVILAAGRGTRLGALTTNRTKAMLPVLGKPIMVRVMDRIREAGIRRFIVVIGTEDGGLAAYLSSSWYPNCEVKYVLQPIPKGTADALSLASQYIDGDFLLASVDNLTPSEHIPTLMQHFHDTQADFVLSLIAATPDMIRASAAVQISGDRITQIIEKPEQATGEYASFMLYACKRDFLKYLTEVEESVRGERELAWAIQRLIGDSGHVGYLVADQRYHLSHDVDLLNINKSYLDEGRDTHILSDLPGTVTVIPPVRIDPGVRVQTHAKIGPYVYLEAGSSVGEGAVISNAVVLQNTMIGKNEVCENQIVMQHHRIQVQGV
jgi:NDP-sugar pyrophosphorylase family protein